MAVTREQKEVLSEKFGGSAKNTGLTEVQIAIHSEHIKDLTKHLTSHPKDNHTRHGLLSHVGKRKKLLRYLSSKNIDRYRKIISELNIRK